MHPGTAAQAWVAHFLLLHYTPSWDHCSTKLPIPDPTLQQSLRLKLAALIKPPCAYYYALDLGPLKREHAHPVLLNNCTVISFTILIIATVKVRGFRQ